MVLREIELMPGKVATIEVPGFDLARTGLSARGTPTFEEWEACGQFLSKAEGAVHWWLGDWLNYGEQEYGELYSQALDESRFDYQTLRNDAWVSNQIAVSRRRDTLPWSLHAELAALSPDKQDYWLNQAEHGDGEKRWTRGQLRQALREDVNRRKQARPFPIGKFRVVYADPPWSYSNSGFDQSAASQYPTMTVDDMCALKDADGNSVKELFSAETVLFLWATSPLLPDAFDVLEAWGFTYKASMVWDKGEAPEIGWFVHTQHEFLLIATREANAHPISKPISVARIQPTGHSVKPEQYYETIESMYAGPYIELFARNKREGWQSWGNEVESGNDGREQAEKL